MEVILNDVLVMYVDSPEGAMNAPKAFKKLEDAIGWKLKGRRFYGTELNGQYRANLVSLNDEEINLLKFPTWIIPGGRYYKGKIEDWEKHISEIASKCEEIISKVKHDTHRPVIEYYRSQKELFLYVPIL